MDHGKTIPMDKGNRIGHKLTNIYKITAKISTQSKLKFGKGIFSTTTFKMENRYFQIE